MIAWHSWRLELATILDSWSGSWLLADAARQPL